MNIEAVKKILIDYSNAVSRNYTWIPNADEHVSNLKDKATKRICHLFPKTEDNPDGYTLEEK